MNNSRLRLYPTSSEVSEVVNDAERGITYIVRNEVVYNYIFPSPLTLSHRIDMDIRLVVLGDSGSGANEERFPLIPGDFVEILPPPGKRAWP